MTYNPWQAWAMVHTLAVSSLSQRSDDSKATAETDWRTDMIDCIIFPVNAVAN